MPAMKKPAAAVKTIMKKPAAAGHSEAVKFIVKKPAGAGQSVPKPPGRAQIGATELTEAAMLQLEGASDEKIEQFLTKLSNHEQNLLWKKFEGKRKMEGTDDMYKQATGGTGAIAKKNLSLKIFLKSGGSTKNSLWKENCQGLANSEGFKTEEKWLTLEEALRKWGKNELKARVLAHTIVVRKDNRDPRFPQFQEVAESRTQEVTKFGKATVFGKNDAKLEDLLAMQDHKINHGFALSFGTQEDAEEEDPMAMASSFLRVGRKAASAAASAMSESDAMIKAWETASAHADTIPKEALNQAKEQCTKLEQMIGQVGAEGKEVQQFKTAKKALFKLNNKSADGVIKKAIRNAAKMGSTVVSQLSE